MAYLYCKNPTHQQITGREATGFAHNQRGRHPQYCPECREVVKPPPNPRKGAIGEEEVQQFVEQYLDSTFDFEDLDERVERVKEDIRERVDASFNDRINEAQIQAEREFAKVRDEVDSYVDKVIEARVPKITIIRTHRGDLNMPHTSHETLPLVMQVLNRKHVFLVGPAGSGKSTIVEQAAEMLGWHFGSMSFGPTTPTSKLFGFIDANGNFNETEFYHCYRCTCGNGGRRDGDPCDITCGGIFLGDELDNGHPGLVAELNQALSNQYCAFANGMAPRSKNFRFCATGNTFGTGATDMKFIGRNMLDFATLNRVAIIPIEYDTAMEYNLAMAGVGEEKDKEWLVRKWIDYCWDIRKNIEVRKIPMIVSPRQTIDGALLLADGVKWDDVAKVLIWAGVDLDSRRDLDVTVDLTPPFVPEPEPEPEIEIEDEVDPSFTPAPQPAQPAIPPKLIPKNKPTNDPFSPRQGWQ